MRNAERMLEEDKKRFDLFLKENDERDEGTKGEKEAEERERERT